METIQLKLYIAGKSPYSIRAMRVVDLLCKRLLGDVKVEIVDILERPEVAEKLRIMATPTLIKSSPLPERRVIGDLSDWNRLVEILSINHLIDNSIKNGDNGSNEK